MQIHDLRPDRDAKKLYLLVRLEEVDLNEVLEYSVQQVFCAPLPVAAQEARPPQPVFFAFTGDDWRTTGCGRLGETPEAALWALYDAVASEIERAGSLSREAADSGSSTYPLDLRELPMQGLESALREAEEGTLRKFARRVRRGRWQLALEVCVTVAGQPTLETSVWQPPCALAESGQPVEEEPLAPLAEAEVCSDQSSALLPRIAPRNPSSSRRLSMAGGGSASDAELEILVDRRDRKTAVVWVDGIVDNDTACRLEDILCELLESGVLHVVLEVRHLQYLNSTGLGLLVTCGDVLQEHGGRLVLVGASPRLQSVLGILEQDVFFESVPELEAALGA